ncbi:MAG: LPS export ABC transporter periplasmic protein LptC [Pseudomonadota bacterium]
MSRTPPRIRALAIAIALYPPIVAAQTAPVPEGEPTLEVTRFTLHATDASGQPSHYLEGSRLREFGRNGPQYIDDPRLDLLDARGLEWRWTAPEALYLRDQARLNLFGPTHGLQPARDDRVRTEIDSRDVQVDTDNLVATSEQPATLRQPGLLHSGVGLRLDSRADTMTLFSDVHTRYSETSEEDAANAAAPPTTE